MGACFGVPRTISAEACILTSLSPWLEISVSAVVPFELAPTSLLMSGGSGEGVVTSLVGIADGEGVVDMLLCFRAGQHDGGAKQISPQQQTYLLNKSNSPHLRYHACVKSTISNALSVAGGVCISHLVEGTPCDEVRITTPYLCFLYRHPAPYVLCVQA